MFCSMTFDPNCQPRLTLGRLERVKLIKQCQIYKSLNFQSCRVHWAGTESATIWRGYISGGVQSGMRAANEVTERLWPDLPKDKLLQELDAKMAAKERQSSKSSCSVMQYVVLFGYVVLKVFWNICFDCNYPFGSFNFYKKCNIEQLKGHFNINNE